MASCFFLGTGPGFPVAGRFNSAALVDTGGGCLLVDAGEPCAQRLREHGFGLDSLRALLLTHGHADHAGGLPMLLQAMHVGGRAEPFEIFLPGGLAAPLSAWLTACGLFPPYLGFDLRLSAWEDGKLTPGGWYEVSAGGLGLEVDALRNGHLDAARARHEALPPEARPAQAPCFDSYSLRLRGPGWSAVFSSDVASAGDISALCDPPPGLLVCELAHISPAELLEFAGRIRPARLVVTHVQPGHDEELVAMIRERRAGGLAHHAPLLAADGDLVMIP